MNRIGLSVVALLFISVLGFALHSSSQLDVNLSASPGNLQRPGSTDARRESCIAAATARAQEIGRSGAQADQLEQTYQAMLARCSDPRVDDPTSAFIGRMNVDYFRLAAQFVSGQLSSAEYLMRLRDRSHKARLASRDRSFLRSLGGGDDDGDLIPNDLDRCPGTPSLNPTDDVGCPTRERPPQAPSTRAVRAILEKMNIVSTPACTNARVPTEPAPLKFGYDNLNRQTFAMAITRVRNQPAGCGLFYEMDFRLSHVFEKLKNTLPDPAFAEFIFRDSDSTDHTSTGNVRVVFRIRQTDPDGGNRLFLFENYARYGLVEWRVRAINFNGQASSWSNWQKSSQVSFGEP